MKKPTTTAHTISIMGLLTALLILFSFTPIGTIPIGPLSVTLNIIPLAIAAITLGPKGGFAMGCVFGFLSFLQCLGIGVPSGMGMVLFGINPFLAFIQRFVPRALDGFLVGMLYRFLSERSGKASFFVVGFFSAFLNTVFFMSALVLLFGNTEYVQNLVAGRNILVFICAFVGVNAVVEMAVSTLVTGMVGSALVHARLFPAAQRA